MPSNEKKRQAINFGKVTPISHYKLGATCLAWAESTEYLAVPTQ